MDMADQSEDEDFDRCSTRFLDWLQQNGTKISPKIQLADLRNRNAGRGVIAQEDIEEDEELFNIPNVSILTFETSNIPPDFQGDLSDPWLLLILAMIYEFRKGDASKWKPYFDVLPESFDTLMYWTSEELKILEGSAVLDKIGKEGAERAFAKYLIPVIRRHEAAFFADSLTDDDLLELCHRMGSTIMAYAFDLENTADQSKVDGDGWEEDSQAGDMMPKGMVPLADMLNADADRNNARLFYEEDKVVMKAIKPVKKGEELFNDYGPLPGSDVLRRYGYITDNYVKYDVVELSLDIVKEVAEEELKMDGHEFESRLEYLVEEDAVDDGFDIYRASSENGSFPDELKLFLNALLMPKEGFEKLKKKSKLPKAELSKETSMLLHSILVRRRSMYPENRETSQQHVAENGTAQHGDRNAAKSARRKAMALEVINGEKEILREAAEALRELLSDEKKRKTENFEEDAMALQSASKKKKEERSA